MDVVEDYERFKKKGGGVSEYSELLNRCVKELQVEKESAKYGYEALRRHFSKYEDLRIARDDEYLEEIMGREHARREIEEMERIIEKHGIVVDVAHIVAIQFPKEMREFAKRVFDTSVHEKKVNSIKRMMKENATIKSCTSAKYLKEILDLFTVLGEDYVQVEILQNKSGNVIRVRGKKITALISPCTEEW